MEQELKRIVQTVNRLSLLYWQPSGFQSQEQIRSLMTDWRQAFNWFLSSFAFERQGRSPHYSTAAVKAVELYKGKLPNHDFEKEIWKNFLASGRFPDDGAGANTKNNPLFLSKNEIESVSGLIASLEDYDFNIVKWASSLAMSGDVEIAWNRLVKIRGIGRKIASLFLRDIVYAFEIDESTLKGKIYLQPIDVWTERGAKALAQLLSKTPSSYWECAEVLVEVSACATVRPTLTNVGLWVLGAQLVSDAKQFHNLLVNADDLYRFLANQIHWHQNRVKVLEMVLNVPD